LSKRDEHDVADALLAKAVGDEAGLRALVANHDVPDHVAGFLAIGVEESTEPQTGSSAEVETPAADQ
jgi:hypothetical protein